MNRMFAPGCALMLYRPELAHRMHSFLNRRFGPMEMLLTCCHHEPALAAPAEVINVCPGCDKRFGQDYRQTTTLSLWELLSEDTGFPFPDYRGQTMAILDACPTRDKDCVHQAVRRLMQRMNIRCAEPEKTRTRGTCCGDRFYGTLAADELIVQMKKRTAEMPAENVVVYCVSCANSVLNGGKKPRYLVDLLFGEDTAPSTIDPDLWHRRIDEYIERHGKPSTIGRESAEG